METIVFLERGTFRVDFRRPHFEHQWIDFNETRVDQVVERLQNATIAICNKLPLNKRELSRVVHLRLIAVAATGVDNVDLEYCRERGIGVCNMRNYAAHSVPEHVLMQVLALRRNLLSYNDAVRAGRWQEARQFCLLDYPIRDLYGSTIGIIGYGFLGRAMAQLARAVGMRVAVAEHKNDLSLRDDRQPFHEVLQRSDVISLHCPLTEATRDLIAAPEFKQMRRDAVLINTARGGLVNDSDLLEALRLRLIAGAAIDVLRTEPPKEANLLLEADLPNLIITPHVAWASQEAMQTLADQLVENLEAFVRGEWKNRIV